MRFIADMGISLKTVNWLRSIGHDVIHLSEEGLQKLADEKIFIKAVEESRVILTMDLDFSQIVAASKGNITSVIVFRLSDERSENVNSKLNGLLGKNLSDLEEGSIVSVGDNSYRIRRFPIK